MLSRDGTEDRVFVGVPPHNVGTATFLTEMAAVTGIYQHNWRSLGWCRVATTSSRRDESLIVLARNRIVALPLFDSRVRRRTLVPDSYYAGVCRQRLGQQICFDSRKPGQQLVGSDCANPDNRL